VITIAVYEHQDHVKHARHFCDIHGVKGTTLVDEDNAYSEVLGLRGVPMNVVMDKKGIIRAFGMTSPDEVRATLTQLMRPF